MRTHSALSPKLAPMLVLATILSSGCGNPTASSGLDGDYTLVGTSIDYPALPGQVRFYPASYGSTTYSYDTLGYLTHGSLHIDGSHFTTALQFQRGTTQTGPVETATSGGDFSLALKTYTGQGILGLGTSTITELNFRNVSGDLLGHPLGGWGILGRDGQLVSDREIIINYGTGTALIFARN